MHSVPQDADHGAVGAIILGAGFSRRFGSDKRLHPHNGRTVAETTVLKYLDAFTHIRVVIRPEDDELNTMLSRFPIEIICAEDAHAGMGHSLAAGFKALTWHWAFIALLDMPFVQTSTLIELKEFVMSNPEADILRPYLPATSSSPVNRGHPVGWHERYFQQLSACRGDVGAKALLQQYADNITDIAVNDAGIIRDIDRPSDLAQP